MIREPHENQIEDRVREDAETASTSAIDSAGHTSPRPHSGRGRGWARFLNREEREQVAQYERCISDLRLKRRALAKKRRRYASRSDTNMALALDDMIKALDRSRRSRAAERAAIVNRGTKRRRRVEGASNV